MKANELMIGDWVRFDMSISYKNPQGNGMWVNCQVESISRPMFKGRTRNLFLKGDNYYGGYERTLGEIEPIPLTPEILEKNGFIIKKKWAQIGNFGNSPLIIWHFEDDSILHDFKHELEIHQNDTGKVHVKIPCEYVHELQHALRLCGVEKEIEL